MSEYGLEDFVKGRVDDGTLDRIAKRADKLQRDLTEEDEEAIANDWNLTGEDIRTAEKAAKLIVRDHDKTLRMLSKDAEDEKYRREIVK